MADAVRPETAAKRRVWRFLKRLDKLLLGAMGWILYALFVYLWLLWVRS